MSFCTQRTHVKFPFDHSNQKSLWAGLGSAMLHFCGRLCAGEPHSETPAGSPVKRTQQDIARLLLVGRHGLLYSVPSSWFSFRSTLPLIDPSWSMKSLVFFWRLKSAPQNLCILLWGFYVRSVKQWATGAAFWTHDPILHVDVWKPSVNIIQQLQILTYSLSAVPWFQQPECH